jgi:hypothetical protein
MSKRARVARASVCETLSVVVLGFCNLTGPRGEREQVGYHRQIATREVGGILLRCYRPQGCHHVSTLCTVTTWEHAHRLLRTDTLQDKTMYTCFPLKAYIFCMPAFGTLTQTGRGLNERARGWHFLQNGQRGEESLELDFEAEIS